MSTESPVLPTSNVFIGEDRVLRFSIVDSGGIAQNVTGWAIQWVLRSKPQAPTAVLTKTIGSGVTVVNAAGGIFDVHLTKADTLSLYEGTLYHTLKRTDAAAETVLAFGSFSIRYAATR